MNTRKPDRMTLALDLAGRLEAVEGDARQLVFVSAGGALSFRSNTHRASYAGITATCTEGYQAAIRAWVRKVLA